MTRLPTVVIGLVCIVVLLTSTVTNAEMCFRGRPVPECRTFWITEVGLGYRISHPDVNERGWPTSEIGLMYNLNEHYAIGATSYASYDAKFEEFRGGAKLRARRWFNRDLSVDVSGGLLFLGHGYHQDFPSFTGHLDVNYKDVVAPYLAVDVLREEHSSLDGANWQAGLRFGSFPGSGLTGIAIGLVAVGLFMFITAP